MAARRFASTSFVSFAVTTARIALASRPDRLPQRLTAHIQDVGKAIAAGSYVHIPNMNAIRGEAITFAALVMPTWLGKRATQCIVSRQHRSSKGVALIVDPSGRGGLWLHDGAREVLVTCDSGHAGGAVGICWSQVSMPPSAKFGFCSDRLAERIASKLTLSKTDQSTSRCLPCRRVRRLIAARRDPDAGIVAQFDGRIEAPAVYRGALEADQFSRLTHPFEIDLPAMAGWDFSRHIGSADVADVSGNNSHGRCINLPTRAVIGHAWRGQTMDWRTRPDLYGAIHFHSDDLEDCGWSTDATWRIPAEIRSGIYAADLTTDGVQRIWCPCLSCRRKVGRRIAGFPRLDIHLSCLCQ